MSLGGPGIYCDEDSTLEHKSKGSCACLEVHYFPLIPIRLLNMLTELVRFVRGDFNELLIIFVEGAKVHGKVLSKIRSGFAKH